jgi:hypothetical protein
MVNPKAGECLPNMLGFGAARRAVVLGRIAFFPDRESDLPPNRSALLRSDDLVPQFGFAGARYLSKRVFRLGINPGNGPRNDIRTPGDERMMPPIIRFSQSPTEQNFAAAVAAYMG